MVEKIVVPKEAPKGKLSIGEALQRVPQNALVHDRLSRGLRECTKPKINLIKVRDAMVLSTWAGLCKIDREGGARKVVGCTCRLKEYGVESEGLLDYFKNR
ncbi:hypothetical protein B0H12DRAFT_1206205 [Mycena haematopus]|nr:hypothetical protein B0H12DRAFT_1206205 [Mycena haematopus]